MSKLKIAFDGTILKHYPVGIAKYTHQLYCELKENNSDLEFLILGNTNYEKWIDGSKKNLSEYLLKNFNISIKAFKLIQKIEKRMQRIGDLVWKTFYLPVLIRINRVDIVIFPWNGKVPYFIPSKVKVISVIHDVLPLEIPGFLKNNFREILYKTCLQKDIKLSNLVVTDSIYSQKIIENFCIKENPRVIYLGTNIMNQNKKIEINHQKNRNNYYLYLGGYDKRKGLEELLKAYVSAKKEANISTKLFIVGKKKYISEDFEELLDYGKEDGSIKELGFLSEQGLSCYLKCAKALIYPSKYEGFGLPVLEAMTLGTPVITTKYSSLPEVGGDAVLYVEPDDLESFKAKLIGLESCPEELNELSKKGLVKSREFSWKITARKMVQLFLELK